MTEIVAPFTTDRPEREALRRDHSVRRAVLRVVWITLLLNLVNVVIKFTIGFATRNMTILADAVHASIDAANNIMGIVTLNLAYRPPDLNHPYGHRKFEAVASLAIGGLMALTAWEILKNNAQAVWQMIQGQTQVRASFTKAGLALILVGFAINVFITIYEHRRGVQLKSQFLIADAMHTRSDLFVTGLSLTSLVLAPRLPLLDVTLSFLIVGLILRAGWRVIHENLLLLTDAAQMDPGAIQNVVEDVEGVENCHAIRTHGMPDEVHMDLHIVVPAKVSAGEAHQIENKVRAAVMEAFPEVVEVAIHHQVHQPGTGLPLRRNPS